MGSSPRPATVHNLGQDGNPILHSRRSASRVTKASSSSPPQSRANTSHATSQGCIFGKSICKGPIEEMVKAHSRNREHPLTIFTRSQDTSPERNVVPGYPFRKVFFTDETEILNPGAVYDRDRYVRLTAFIPKKEEDSVDPKIYVEQRIYEGRQEKIMVLELHFGHKIQVGIEYVFPGCGDEHINLGKRDLRLHIQSLEQGVFDSYILRANYYGYDIEDYAYVNRHTISNGLSYVPRRNGEIANFKICLNAQDLQILLDAKRKNPLIAGSLPDDRIELLHVRFAGLGEYAGDKTFAGDLNIRVMWSP
ncbi:hypothetical protein BDV29DRAFT_183529 [Aspergillus leporis]|uniref:Uncharacterized protein n=1 Tax=Aspergillus leporis TaxID=41062 RepID=A0A5N5WKH7_9EURO|nr:hypothetical protein BDV29DRAFT_183529 [Aspergillus leporis]